MPDGGPVVTPSVVDGLPVYAVSFSGGGARGLFTTRLGGVSEGHLAALNLGAMVGDDPKNVRENRSRVCRAMGTSLDHMVTADQVHGTRVLQVDDVAALAQGSAGNPVAGEGDILITNKIGILLTVLVADCVPILMYDRQKHVTAAVHAGWRGTASVVAQAAVSALVEHYDTSPADLQVVVGPSIGPCCYEVDRVVIEPLRDTLAGKMEGVVRFTGQGVGMLNLWEANRRLLVSAGVDDRKLLVTGLCTACDTSRFYSHRAEEGHTGRMAAIITLD